MTFDAIVYDAPLHGPVTDPLGFVVNEGECLYCYLCRSLPVHGCRSDYAITERWLAVQASPLADLPVRLRRLGGYCDCEVLLNVFTGIRVERLQCQVSFDREQQCLDEEDQEIG